MVLRNNLDEATERLRDTKFELFSINKEYETLKQEKQSSEASAAERSKSEQERFEKETRRLRRKIDHLEEERRESERLHERVSLLDAETHNRQEIISNLESRLATQSEQLRRAEQELAKTSSSSKTLDDDRKVSLFSFLLAIVEIKRLLNGMPAIAKNSESLNSCEHCLRRAAASLRRCDVRPRRAWRLR